MNAFLHQSPYMLDQIHRIAKDGEYSPSGACQELNMHWKCELPAYLRLLKYAGSPKIVHIYDPAYFKSLRYAGNPHFRCLTRAG